MPRDSPCDRSRRARRRDRRVPRVPAARRVARAGRGARSARRSATRLLGPAGARASAIREARVLIVGLAPAAHGGNRTGRVFTGDRSGDFLFASLYRTGFANQPTSVARRRRPRAARRVHRRRGAVRAAREQADAGRARRVPCRTSCASCELLDRVRVIVALGAFGYEAAVDGAARVAGVELPAPPAAVRARRSRCRAAASRSLGAFHPSQQNTFTGRLTPPMLDAVFDARARAQRRARRARRPRRSTAIDAERGADGVAQRAVVDRDREVGADPRAGDHADRRAGSRTPSRCGLGTRA